jgi:hypothetical protein
MISFPRGVKIWLAAGYTDMRRGFPGLSLMVQETLKRDIHGSRSERKARILEQMELQLEEFRRAIAAGGTLLCLARSAAGASRAPSEELHRHSAGRRLWRLQSTIQGRYPRPLTPALCWAHSRRKFFVLADIATNAKRGKNAAPISPVALEAVKRIDAPFDVERDINGLAATERLQRRQQESCPLVDPLEEWMRTERAKLPRSSPVCRAN